MSLADERCVRKATKLESAEVEALLAQVPGYELDTVEPRISKQYRFADFYETMAFVNALAFIANQQDHHPDLQVSYGSCQVAFSTHDAGGLTRNDFVCAARVEALQSQGSR